MNVASLRAMLARFPDDAEVRLLLAPVAPEEFTVAGAVSSQDVVADPDGDVEAPHYHPPVLYLCQGRFVRPGLMSAWNAITP